MTAWQSQRASLNLSPFLALPASFLLRCCSGGGKGGEDRLALGRPAAPGGLLLVRILLKLVNVW